MIIYYLIRYIYNGVYVIVIVFKEKHFEVNKFKFMASMVCLVLLSGCAKYLKVIDHTGPNNEVKIGYGYKLRDPYPI